MKKIKLLFVILIFSCSGRNNDMSISYSLIEKEIQFYTDRMTAKAGYYVEKKDKKNQNNLNSTLHYKVLDFYFYTNTLIISIKNYPPNQISFEYYDSVIKSVHCSGLENGQLDSSRFFDTLYLHNVKFEYIKCLIKNSKYYDSMPELKARIESYKD